jgi:hypothetical protein
MENNNSNTIVNPFEFGYTEDQVVMIPANDLLNLLFFATKVKQSQPTVGVLYEYPDTVANKRDKEGVLTESTVEWKEYTDKEAKVFFQNVNKPLKIATELSMLSDQILFSLMKIHEQNINKGIAKKNEELS